MIEGNYIGLNPTGSSALGNAAYGVSLTQTGGSVPGATIDRNVLSASGLSGINIGNNVSGAIVTGNFIGTDATGTISVPSLNGIFLAGINATIGGTSAAARNVISGNSQNGVMVGGSGHSILGNFIGTTVTGTAPLPNLIDGVAIQNSSNNTIGGVAAGQANTIAFNGAIGIDVISGTNNAIRGNSIYSNGALGIDLGDNGATANDPGDGDTGPNNFQNFPVPTSASDRQHVVAGTFNSTATTAFALDFFASPSCSACREALPRVVHGDDRWQRQCAVQRDAGGCADRR